jgi:hypothetical protein
VRYGEGAASAGSQNSNLRSFSMMKFTGANDHLHFAWIVAAVSLRV